MDPIIRKANSADSTAIDDLNRKCFAADLAFQAGAIFNLLDQNETEFYLLENDGETIGFIWVLRQTGISDDLKLLPNEKAVLQIGSLAIAPKHQNQGLAKRLINYILEMPSPYADCNRIIAETFADKFNYRSLYERSGFTQIERIAKYYPDGRDAIRFELCL